MAKALYHRFAQPLDDGRFLIRPHGPLGKTYAVNERVKDAFLRYRQISNLSALGIFFIGLFAGMDLRVLFVVILACYACDCLMRLRYVRGAEKMPKNVWAEPPQVDTGSLFPRWAYYFILIPVLLLLEYTSARAIFALYQANGTVPVESFLLSGLWTFFLWLSWRDLRKAKPKKPGSTGETGLQH